MARNINPNIGKNFRYTGRNLASNGGSSPRNITGKGTIRYSDSYQQSIADQTISNNARNEEPTAGQLIKEMRQTPNVDAYSYVLARSKQARGVEAALAKEKTVNLRSVNRGNKFLEKYNVAMADPQAKRVEAALAKETEVTLRSKGPRVQTYDDINLYRTSRINPSEYKQQDRAFVERLKKISEREQNLQTFKEKLYRGITLVKGVSLAEHPIDNTEVELTSAQAKQAKGFARFNLKTKAIAQKTTGVVREFTKAAARVPIELASMPLIIGGRTALAYDVYYRALKDKITRSDILIAIKDIPKEVRSQFNPKTPDGQVNLVLAGLGVLEVGSMLKSKGAKGTDIKIRSEGKATRLAEYETEAPKVTKSKLNQVTNKLRSILREGISRIYKVSDKTLRESRGLTKKQWDVLGDKTQARIRADYEKAAKQAAAKLNTRAAKKLLIKQKEAFRKVGLIDRKPTTVERAKLTVRKFTRSIQRLTERAKNRIKPKSKSKTTPFEYLRREPTIREKYAGMTGEEKIKLFRKEEKAFKREAARPYRKQGASPDQLIENLKRYNIDMLVMKRNALIEGRSKLVGGKQLSLLKLENFRKKAALESAISKGDLFEKYGIKYVNSEGKQVFDIVKYQKFRDLINEAVAKGSKNSGIGKKGQIQILKQVEKHKIKVVDLDKLVRNAKERMRTRTKLSQPELELKPIKMATVAKSVSKGKALSIPILKVDIKPKQTPSSAAKSRMQQLSKAQQRNIQGQESTQRIMQRLKQYQAQDILTEAQTGIGQKRVVAVGSLTAISTAVLTQQYVNKSTTNRPPKPKVLPLPPLSGGVGPGDGNDYFGQYFKFTHTIERPSRAIPKSMRLRRFTGAELR